jgi:hypothetical protein
VKKRERREKREKRGKRGYFLSGYFLSEWEIAEAIHAEELDKAIREGEETIARMKLAIRAGPQISIPILALLKWWQRRQGRNWL